MTTTIIRPAYYRVIERVDNTWKFRQGKPFYNPDCINGYSQTDIFTDYRLTLKKVAIELFRINGGKSGYYLANLRDRKYYYCGLTLEDVKETLYSLGIGVKNATT
jgi:hypothetical protein